MDPLRIKPTNINDIRRCYSIDQPTTITPLGCSVGVACVPPLGAGIGVQPAAIVTESGPLLRVIPIPVQMATSTQDAVGTPSVVINTMTAPPAVMPPMAIIRTTTDGTMKVVGQTNSELDYYQLQQQMQEVASETVTPTTLNVFVESPTTPGATEEVCNKVSRVDKPSLVERPAAEKFTASFIKSETPNVLPLDSKEWVKKRVEGKQCPVTSSGITNHVTSPTRAAHIKMKQPQQIHNTRPNQKPRILKSSLHRSVFAPKTYVNTSKIASSNNDNCLDTKMTTYAPRGATALYKKNCAVPISVNSNSNGKTVQFPSDTSAVTQISDSVTLCLVRQRSPAPKESQDETAEVVCTSSAKELPTLISSEQSSTTAAIKRESLLRLKPVPSIIEEIISLSPPEPSKSFNSVVSMKDEETPEQQTIIAEGKRSLQRISPPKITKPTIKAETLEVCDEEVKKKVKLEVNEDAKESACLNECIDFEEEYLDDDGNEEEGELTANEIHPYEESLAKIVAEPEASGYSDENLKENTEPTPEEQEADDVQKPIQPPSVVVSSENQALSEDMSLLRIKEEPQLDDEIIQNDETVFEQPELDLNIDKTLLCEEKILVSSSTSVSNSSNSVNNSDEYDEMSCNTYSTAINTLGDLPTSTEKTPTDTHSYETVLEMLSTFNMLTWRERIGTAHGTNLRFQLNDFNLLEIYERCPPRYNIHTAFEKPIYERESHSVDNTGALLYLCRRCNCHGPAAEFLAPEFCSVECVKRDSRKRQRDLCGGRPTRKRARKQAPGKITSDAYYQPSEATKSTSSLSVKKFFRWSTYLTGKCGEIAAPVNLFLNPFPTGPNHFQIGMKLEAIDPENCALFCVCTVADIQGYRLNLTFDGYDRMYNFWVNADSMDIFPPGWCAKTNRILQPPRDIEASKFNWPTYFAREKAIAAPRQLFTHLKSSASSTRNPFKIGMHLEAEDLNDTGKLCVACVSDVLDDRIRIHFNGWDDCYDYWVDTSSPYIHPCGWHEGRQQLIVPPDFENTGFTWSDYLRGLGPSAVAPPSFFSARDPIEFKPKMKLEVVDPRNPVLIRPATVVARRGHRIKLHLDLWPREYCFWLEDDSPDLHPIGWCDATGHDLEPPPGYQTRPTLMPCSVSGCRGIGNARCHNLVTHSTLDSCPYAPKNWSIKREKPPRVDSNHIERKITAKSAHWEQQSTLHKPKDEVLQTRRSSEAKQTTVEPATLAHSDAIVENSNLLDAIQTRRSLEESLEEQQLQNDFPAIVLDKLLELKHELSSAFNEGSMDDASSSTSLKSKSSSVSAVSETSAPDVCSLQITKEYLCDYGPRLQQNYKLWLQHLNANYDSIKKNPMHWSTAETSVFVESLLNCAKTAAIFKHEDIDGSALLALQQSDLTDILEIKLGKAVKLYAHIMLLRTWTVAKFDIKTVKNL